MAKILPALALFFGAYLSSGANAKSSDVNIEPSYDWAAALTLESIHNIDGGVKKGSRELANLDLNVTINTAAAGWWQGGEWFIYGLGNAGKNPSDYTGDLQGVSNIAAAEAVKIYEFWYQHSFADDRFKVLAGLHDYNSTFYTLASAGLFTHPSFGIGPDTSQVGPSIFSTTAVALHLTLQGEHQYLLAASYDGIAGDPDNSHGTHIQFNEGDGLFNALEWGWLNDEGTKLAIGFWQHSAEVENPVDGLMSDNNSGLYVIGETSLGQTLFNKHTHAFFQLGRADPHKNQLEYYVGTGIIFDQLWREGDNLGLAVAHARNGDSYLAQHGECECAETAWELSYFLPLREHVAVQSSVYYLQNPSMDKTLENAFAVGFRLYLEI